MQKERTGPGYPAKILRIILKTIGFILLFILLIFFLLFTPPVQRFLTARVQHYLENKLHTRVLIGRISFGLSGKVGLDKIYLADRTGDTLVSGGSIRGHLNLLKLFSNEVKIEDLELQNITLKIKRELPDTVYNFQFLIDAFIAENNKSPDTSASAPMKLAINDVFLKNIQVSYKDAVAGTDMSAHIGEFAAHIDTLDPYTQHYVIPTILLGNSTGYMKQVKPLVAPHPLAKDTNNNVASAPMDLQLGNIVLEKVGISYSDDESALYATADIGELKIKERFLDLQHNKMDLDKLVLNNSKIVTRFGKSKQGDIANQDANKSVDPQKQAAWDFRINNLDLKNNSIQFDDDNKMPQSEGIDFSHIAAGDLSLAADHFIMTPDSVAINVSKGSVNEKSGLKLEQIQGDILYANDQTYLRNLYLKTPGTEIRKTVELKYPSLDALAKHFDQSSVRIEILDSRVQVKDILLFAPQLRKNPALRHPDDIWKLNLVGSGTLNQFNIESLQFDGLANTQIDAHGSLTGLTDLKKAGGNFVINRFHTNQDDISLFTGSKLSNEQMDLPEDFTLSGNINGNAGILNTRLNIFSSDGSLTINGKLGNLNNPVATDYYGTITTSNLQLGRILRQPGTIGSLSATMIVNGKGLTPNSINTKFTAKVSSAGFEQYQYRNINLSGSLHKTNFEAEASIKDPNADANFVVSGNFSDHPAFKIKGIIDSLKTMPLHLTPKPLIVRGKIEGEASNITADNIDANILVTQSLFVSGNDRLVLDTIQLQSGKTDTANFIHFKSSIASANLSGHYRLQDLGSIIQNTIQPYFSTTSLAQKTIPPYNFSFNVDVIYDPILSAAVPGLTEMKSLHAAGNFSNDGGMNAELVIPSITYQGSTMSDLKVTANTSSKGLQITGVVAHIKSGNSFDIYNARLNALALNNTIDFSLGIDDANAKNKYFIEGLFAQPSSGKYTVQLKPGDLILNYQKWTVAPANLITFSTENITASNFVLQSGDQRLSINSPGDQDQHLLQIDFSNFRLATITGFVKSDSVLADGLINGNVKLADVLKQPNITSDLTINDLSLRNDTVGNLTLHATTPDLNKYNIETTITGRGNDVALKGWIATVGSDINMDLDLQVRALQLQTMEGAMAGAIRNASGELNGAISIKGSVNQPSVQGNLNFRKAGFVLTMLGSQFYLDEQKLSVTNEGLTFNNFAIKDSSGNAITFNGNISTTNFINYEFNLKVRARNFQLLNSVKKDNPIYYGRMNINSDIVITGTEVKPVVDGKITVNDGTVMTFVVPQTSQNVEAREGIVEFVDMRNPANDTLFKTYDSLNHSGVLGMDIALNIEIKKEAIFNIVVDAANGDFLNAQGEALLTAGIDPSGKITLTGNYTLEKGAYQLSFNFLQRRFEINKGSTITWTGEPTSAKLDVTAIYIANTAPIDLVQDQVEGSSAAIRNTYLQKLPFELHLNLTGELMKPVVGFDIVLPENKNYGVSNDVVTTVQYKLLQLREDEGETNKQVFSLLLLNRFVGDNPFNSAGGGGFNAGTYARQSASKLLTEQLNSLAAGLINGVDVNFDVASTEDYTTGSMKNRTDLALNVSKRMLNDRLKISVGSNFELEGPQNSNQQANNIAGDVAIDYQLSRDGRYFIRYFRKNDYEGEVDGYVIENGLSFIITIDYNRFKEILHHRRQKVTGIDNKQKVVAQ